MWVRTLKQVNVNKPDGLPGSVFQACSDLYLTRSVITTCSNQTNTSPFTQERQDNLSKWLSPCSTHICSHEMLWKAGHGSHQQHHPRHHSRSPPIHQHSREEGTTMSLSPSRGWKDLSCACRSSKRSTAAPLRAFWRAASPPGMDTDWHQTADATESSGYGPDLYTRRCQRKAPTEGSGYGPVHHQGRAPCHSGPREECPKNCQRLHPPKS